CSCRSTSINRRWACRTGRSPPPSRSCSPFPFSRSPTFSTARRSAACEGSMRLKAGDVAYEGAVWAVAAFAMLLLLAPTVVVLVTSFTGEQTLKFPPPTWSVRWYVELAQSADLIGAAWTSLKLAAFATVACGVLGTAAALGIARSRSAAADLLDSLFMSPMVLPAMAFGLALLMVFSVLSVRLSLWTLVIGHVEIGRASCR